jgi:ABC-type uncharacterized transport system permease subunit
MQSSTYIPYLAVVLNYALVASDFWRAANKTSDTNQNLTLRWHTVFIALGLLIHGGLLYQDIFIGDLNLNIANTVSAILWLTVLIYWIANFKHQLNSLQAFVLPPAALAVIVQGCFHNAHINAYASDGLFLTHILIAMLAYSLFTFAALHASLMAMAERSLHQKNNLVKLPSFPPILMMEVLLFRIIGLGFILLTFTLISGMLFSEQIFHQALKINHKNIFAIISWLIYGGLLIGRLQYGWRGRTAIRWTLSGFIILLLAYVGTKFVLEVLLGR